MDIRRRSWIRGDGTRPVFAALCVYMASQAFMIPVAPLGPSWALWPTLTEFALFTMLVLVVVRGRPVHSTSRAETTILFWIAILTLAFGANFAAQTVRRLVLDPSIPLGSDAGVMWGSFMLYRLMQVVALLWVLARIPLSDKRLRIVKRIVTGAIVFVSLVMASTYLDIVPLSALVFHLPAADPDVAGPWYRYRLSGDLTAGERGMGTIGYDHAYAGAQLILLVGFRIYLSHLTSPKSIWNALILLIGGAGIFFSGSRSGLVGFAVLALWYFVTRPVRAIVVAVPALAGLLVLASFAPPAELEEMVERNAAILQPTDPDSLSGRLDIWQDRLQFLNEHALRWIAGTGVGTAVTTGVKAHNVFLHTIAETGLVGLLATGFFFARILHLLFHSGEAARAMVWTTLALLVVSLAQDTFYPVPHMGMFLGLYLATVAIAVRRRNRLPLVLPTKGRFRRVVP